MSDGPIRGVRRLTAAELLPHDAAQATLIGRVWSASLGGPCPVIVDGDVLRDLTAVAATVAGLFARSDLHHAIAQRSDYPPLGRLEQFLGDDEGGGPAGRLLAPCDLQPIKAAGVTFAASMLERMIEERAKGDAGRAEEIRARLTPVVGTNLRELKAGSPEAARVKQVLQELAVSRGRHRSRCRGLHQGTADGRGRHRIAGRDPSAVRVEQPRARGRARRIAARRDRRRRAGQ